MTNPSPTEFLLVGNIVASFGVRGQVKLKAITDRPDHLERRIRTLYVGKEFVPYQLKSLFEHKPGLLILTLEGVTTREAADELRTSEVYILEREAAPLREGEYYIHQLYGLQVFTEAGDLIGKVREVITTGAQEILVITRTGQSDALVPMVHEIVTELDIPGGKATIRPLEGLL
jgi:16S rRNA processing protein RimM